MSSELRQFVREALEKKQSKTSIRLAMEGAGWPHDEIATALNAFADIDFPVPVPKRKPYLSAREAFFYLLLFLTLYVSAIGLGTLWFQFINRWLPDPASRFSGDPSLDIIRRAAASLIITFPIFLSVSRILAQAVKNDPEKRASKIRKWLTYLTLFLAAGVIIGDLIALVTNFLSGELTLRFILKIVVVLLIAGTIFGYYLRDLRQEEKEKNV